MNLSPAEAMVLLDPEPENGIPAAKVTFLALLAEGVLKQEITGRFRTVTKLSVARQPAENPPHVAAVLDAVRASKSGTLQDVAGRLSKATRGFSTFVSDLVRPRLVMRRLLVARQHQEQRRILFFFRRTVTVTTWHATEEGAREQDRLRGLLNQSQAIPGLLDENPSRAAVMAMALGPLILLVPALLPFLGQINGAMALHRPDGGSDSSGSDNGGDSAWLSSVDSISADFDSTFDSALSDAASVSSSDSSGSGSSGSDSSSSDSSSDSGGSDGGGGGGE